MLGADRHPARGRLPAHSRIHLFVRGGLSKGRDLRLSDHADIEHGLLSGLPQRPVAKVCQARYPPGARRRPQPSLRRPGGSRQYLAALPYSPELNPKKISGNEIREKIFKNYALKSIDAVRAKLKQTILYIERDPETVKSITSFPYIVRSL